MGFVEQRQKQTHDLLARQSTFRELKNDKHFRFRPQHVSFFLFRSMQNTKKVRKKRTIHTLSLKNCAPCQNPGSATTARVGIKSSQRDTNGRTHGEPGGRGAAAAAAASVAREIRYGMVWWGEDNDKTDERAGTSGGRMRFEQTLGRVHG